MKITSQKSFTQHLIHRYTSTTMPIAAENQVPQITAQVPEESSKRERSIKVSKAMRAYLQRAIEHDDFMAKESAEYEIGKRHLANMMGVDADNFTQVDIDKAVEYLMPSGLYEPKARPLMKPPSEVHPKKKAAEFDIMGRPFHCFFYTCRPNYYQLLHEVANYCEELNACEDQMIANGIKQADPENKVPLVDSEWVKKETLEDLIVEKLHDNDHAYFVSCLARLADHPYSARCQDFISKFRRKLAAQTTIMDIPPLLYDENGRPYMEANGRRKWANAAVTLRGNGTGKIDINGKDITYFKSIQSREQVMFPLQFNNLLGTIDLECTVTSKGGHSAEAGAIRHGLSLALMSFLTKEEVERMRLAGLLTYDRRTRERKKTGQKGARAKYTWKKR